MERWYYWNGKYLVVLKPQTTSVNQLIIFLFNAHTLSSLPNQAVKDSFVIYEGDRFFSRILTYLRVALSEQQVFEE